MEPEGRMTMKPERPPARRDVIPAKAEICTTAGAHPYRHPPARDNGCGVRTKSVQVTESVTAL